MHQAAKAMPNMSNCMQIKAADLDFLSSQSQLEVDVLISLALSLCLLQGLRCNLLLFCICPLELPPASNNSIDDASDNNNSNNL